MQTHTNPEEVSAEAEQAELTRLLAERLAPIAPSPGQRQNLRSKLLERISRSIAAHSGLLTVRSKDGVWQALKVGIRFKTLWEGPEGNSVLIEFAPGTTLPVHRHSWLEEGIVLQGRLQMGELDLGPCDYHVSPPGSRHGRIGSREGALAYLRGTSLGHRTQVLRELLGGLLPLGGAAARTTRADAEGWVEVVEGVTRKDLWREGGTVSCFYRLQPGGRLPAHAHVADEECMMLEGEAFLGDILLRAGDYQLAPAGSRHGEVSSDVGGLLFLRGVRDW